MLGLTVAQYDCYCCDACDLICLCTYLMYTYIHIRWFHSVITQSVYDSSALCLAEWLVHLLFIYFCPGCTLSEILQVSTLLHYHPTVLQSGTSAL